MAIENQKIDIAAVARMSLLEMAKDRVSPSPENYKKYFERLSGRTVRSNSGINPDLLQKMRNQIPENFQSSHLKEWKIALDKAVHQGDLSDIEKIVFKVLTETIDSGNRSKEILDEKAKERNLSSLLYILESFAGSLAVMFPDHPVLNQQVEIIQDVLLNPENPEKLLAAKRSLNRLKPVEINEKLTAAKDAARQMVSVFMSQMSEAGNATNSVQEVMEKHQDVLSNSKSAEEVMSHVKSMVSEMSKAGNTLKQVHDRLEEPRSAAEKHEATVSQLEEQLKKVSEEAKKDYLTGLLNRRGLDEELDNVFSSGWEKITISLLDIDNFKTINDVLGHSSGDQALQHLSEVVKDCLAGKGTPARMGGEEFVIVFTGYTAEEIKVEMERTQRELTKRFFMANAEKRLITFSAGVAQRIGEETPSEVISRADDAMYRAKKNGKNRVEISDENLF